MIGSGVNNELDDLRKIAGSGKNYLVQLQQKEAEATGILAKNTEGKMAMTEVVIKPHVVLQDNKMIDPIVLDDLFKKAHENCFISCSIKTR